MNITEQEAAGKWCPFARVANLSNACNRYETKTADGSNCIGSRCMAWAAEEREELEFVFDRRERPDGDGWEPYSDNPNNCAWKRSNTAPRKGHCGLAVSP